MTLNTVESRNKVLYRFRTSSLFENYYRSCGKCLCQRHGVLNGRRLIIKPAPEPFDIIWENQELTLCQKYSKVLVSYLISLLLLAGSFSLISLIIYYQAQLSTQASFSYIFYFYSILCSLAIIVLNAIINFTITRLSIFERHASQTELSISLAWKITWMQFANTTVIPFFLFIYRQKDFVKVDLLSNLFFIFLSSSFVMPLVFILDPIYYWKKFMQGRIQKNILSTHYTQKQANDIFELPPFDISYKYGAFNNIILQAVFNASMFPFGALLQIVGVCLLYWASKFVFVNRSSTTDSISSQLNNSMLTICYTLPFVFVAGFIMQTYVSTGSFFNIANLMALCFCAFVFFIDMIIRGIIKARQNNARRNTLKYEQLLESYSEDDSESTRNSASRKITLNSQQDLIDKFFIDYDALNPILQDEAIRNRKKTYVNSPEFKKQAQQYVVEKYGEDHNQRQNIYLKEMFYDDGQC